MPLKPRPFTLRVLALAAVLAGCGGEPPGLVPGVSEDLAAERARNITGVRYDLTLHLPAARAERVAGSVVVHATLADASRPLVLDFTAPTGSVRTVRANGTEVAAEHLNGHIVIPSAFLRRGDNGVEIEFLAGDGALNRNDEFLYTLFVPDRASSAFPSFDQPDLKARLTLALTLPAAWEAVANGRRLERRVEGDRATIRFAETAPISTYLVAFAAGRWQVDSAVRGGRVMHLYHRETDRAKVGRNRDEIFTLHERALAWLEDYTGIPYPFDKFAFVLVPSFQYGGMEHPGAIFYRASSLWLDESATQNQLLGRASVIAHETAHMWFGNLVTMQWFNDVWMKEVFANFMAAKIVNPSFPNINHDLRFFLAHYPAAYAIDRTAGTHPIRQELDNLNQAGTLYGGIIYQKAPIVMRQLEALVGDTVFRNALREYLDAHRFGNATWLDLVAILDHHSPEDVRAWSRVWVEEAGRPIVRAVATRGAGIGVASLELDQRDPEGRNRVWNQRAGVLVGSAQQARVFPVRLSAPRVGVPEAVGPSAAPLVLPGADGFGYGRFELDSASLAYLLAHLPALQDPVARGAAWVILWDALLEGQAPPRDLLVLGLRALPLESDELNVQRILGYAEDIFWRFLSPDARVELAAGLERRLWERMLAARTATLKATYFRAYRSTALTPEGIAGLRGIWSRRATIPGLRLSEDDYTTLALELAVRGVPDAPAILRAQERRITNPDRRARFVYVLPALSADTTVRDAFFGSLSDPANREHEPWVLDALRFLHHPLRAARAERYILPSLELLEEIQRTGDIFFPGAWVGATLGGHRSPQAARMIREFLEARPDYPPRLKAKILQEADPLFRAARIPP